MANERAPLATTAETRERSTPSNMSVASPAEREPEPKADGARDRGDLPKPAERPIALAAHSISVICQ